MFNCLLSQEYIYWDLEDYYDACNLLGVFWSNECMKSTGRRIFILNAYFELLSGQADVDMI